MTDRLFTPLTSDRLLATVIDVAMSQNGVMESGGRNRGPQVDEYIRTVGLDPSKNGEAGYPWCQCFIYWCFERAAARVGSRNPAPCTASVRQHWEVSQARRMLVRPLFPRDIMPGMVFCTEHDDGHHCGLVINVGFGGIITAEGNTSQEGSREGNSVVVGKMRPFKYVTLGYLDYSGMTP
jgi:hypothetical protein